MIGEIKLKRILTAILAATMVLSFAACGNSSDEGSSASSVANTDDSSKSDSSSSGNASSSDTTSSVQATNIEVDKFPEFIGQYIDVGHYDEKKDDDYISYSKKQEYKQEYEVSGDVHLLKSPIGLESNTEIYDGMSYADFSAQGWKPVEQASLDIEIEPHKYLSKGIEHEDNGKTIEINWGNKTDSTVKLSNAAVERFTIKRYDKLNNYLTPISSATDFLIEGKISGSSGLQEIIETLGEPKRISYSYGKTTSVIDLHYDDWTGSSPQFTLSSDGKTIYRVDLS